MSDFDQFKPIDETAVRFEFGERATHDERYAVGLFDESGAAAWAGARLGKFSEFVDPRVMYITPDSSHHVVWVKHTGMVETPDENLVPYTKYHVVCDCAVMEEESPHPSSSSYCDYVDQVLFQRAAELAKERALPSVLSLNGYIEFDDEEMDFRLTNVGKEIAIKAIHNLIDTDLRHPAYWVANRINGLYEVGPIGAFIGQDVQQARSVLELMERAGLVELNGSQVTVPKNQIID